MIDFIGELRPQRAEALSRKAANIVSPITNQVGYLLKASPEQRQAVQEYVDSADQTGPLSGYIRIAPSLANHLEACDVDGLVADTGHLSDWVKANLGPIMSADALAEIQHGLATFIVEELKKLHPDTKPTLTESFKTRLSALKSHLPGSKPSA